MAMRFEHEFTVPVPVEQTWPALLDVERVAPCLPGAALEAVKDDGLTGRMKVKVGPITIIYRGEATFEKVDEEAHALTLRASGKESRGAGTASATVVARLHPEGPEDASTRVTVETSFTVTGRPAQFGRGVMADVGAKLIDKFAANLSALLEGTATAPSEGPGPVAASPEGETPEEEAGVKAGAGAGVEEAAGAGTAEGRTPSQVPVRPVVEDFGEHDRFFGGKKPRRRLTALPSETATTGEARGRDIHPAGTSRTSRTPDEEALDLLEVAGLPLLKRAAPLIAALTALITVAWLIRRVLQRRGTSR
ncbi:carbon monoxide dehydrogenase subunit G [Streptosporangium violaceochromogenes]|nr:carbon monoxide dehydrogenase subunit G [Streptosporangium violaceochromogenes]